MVEVGTVDALGCARVSRQEHGVREGDGHGANEAADFDGSPPGGRRRCGQMSSTEGMMGAGSDGIGSAAVSGPGLAQAGQQQTCACGRRNGGAR